MRANIPRPERQVHVALNRLKTTDAKTQTTVWAEGPRRELLTPEGPKVYELPIQSKTLITPIGPRTYFDGTLVFRYCETTVLAIDLYHKRLTDFGYHEYSMTTRRYVKDWLDAVEDRFCLRNAIPHDWYRWTDAWLPPRRTGRHRTAPTRETDELLDRFRQKVPWAHQVARHRDRTGWAFDASWWFHWPTYDEQLANELWTSKRFLSEDLNHRYYDYHWSDDPDCPASSSPIRWIRHFKDDDAMRRWRQREKRNGRPCPPT